MNITLTADVTSLVQTQMESGRYQSVSEVIGDALRLLADRDDRRELEKQELRDKIADGLRSLRRGEGVDGEEFFAQLEQEEKDVERSFQPA